MAKQDYNNIGFKNKDIDRLSFRDAFSSARKSGKKTFDWTDKKGKTNTYTTQTAEEKAQYLLDTKQYKKFDSEKTKAGGNYFKAHGVERGPAGSKSLQKSTDEIYRSYQNVLFNGIENDKYKTKYGRPRR